MSELTSLKVPLQVRDRFAEAARTRGITVRALLDQLSRDALDSALLELAAQQMARLRETDPDAWKDYVEEGRTWEEGTVEPLGYLNAEVCGMPTSTPLAPASKEAVDPWSSCQPLGSTPGPSV
jgi:hypothetical protein